MAFGHSKKLGTVTRSARRVRGGGQAPRAWEEVLQKVGRPAGTVERSVDRCRSPGPFWHGEPPNIPARSWGTDMAASCGTCWFSNIRRLQVPAP